MNYDTIGKSKTNSPERAADDLYAESTGVEPKLITNFVPANAVEQRQVFLNGEVLLNETCDVIRARVAEGL